MKKLLLISLFLGLFSLGSGLCGERQPDTDSPPPPPSEEEPDQDEQEEAQPERPQINMYNRN